MVYSDRFGEGKGHGRGGYSVGRMLGEVKTAELIRLTSPTVSHNRRPWPRVSRIPAADSILRPDKPPDRGLDLAERYKILPFKMLEISTFLRNRPGIDDRTIR